jgi:hypothetical protein
MLGAVLVDEFRWSVELELGSLQVVIETLIENAERIAGVKNAGNCPEEMNAWFLIKSHELRHAR